MLAAVIGLGKVIMMSLAVVAMAAGLAALVMGLVITDMESTNE